MKSNRSGELRLKLGIKDKPHIIRFKNCLGSTHLVEDSISVVKIGNVEHVSDVASFSIYNTKLVKDLIELGCVNNKTFKIRIPSLGDGLMRHFIRGYFDGDGCIYINKGCGFCSITSNFEFINDLSQILGYGRIIKHGKVFNLAFYHKEKIRDFYNLLYNESSIYLDRKRMVFEKHLGINVYNS